jgi:hypothetical protein
LQSLHLFTPRQHTDRHARKRIGCAGVFVFGALMTMPERRKTPRARFVQQRSAAHQRAIPWHLTFEEWFDLWSLSGKWHLRGVRAGGYVMARKGDSGAYEIGNVEIISHAQNVRDGHQNTPRRSGPDAGCGRGWTFVAKCTNNPYQVVISGHYIGCFPSAELAEAAYAKASKNFARKRSVQ